MKVTKIILSQAMEVAFLHMFFFFCLSYTYLKFIVTLYGYQGYGNHFNQVKLVVAVSIILMAILVIKNTRKPSCFFLHVALALILTPSMILYYGSDLPNEFAVLTAVSFFIIALVSRYVIFRAVRFWSVSHTTILNLTFSLAFIFLTSFFVFGGGKFINFDISLVYEIRRDAANNLPDFYHYLSSLFSKVIIPFGIVFSLFERKWLLAVVFSVFSIFLFALTAHKSPLIYPFVIAFFYWIAGKEKLAIRFLLALVAVTVLSALDFALLAAYGDSLYGWFGSLFARRSLIVPSDLNFKYFDFFSVHHFYYWAQSKITLGLFDQPYDFAPANLIGWVHFDSEETSANAGWIGSGFSNAGYSGVFIYSVAIGLLLSFLDAYSKKLNAQIIISLFILPILTMLASADLLTMFLTHGLAVAIFLLLIIRPISNVGHSKLP